MPRPILIAIAAALLSLVFSLIVFPRLQSPLNLNPDPDRYGELGFSIAQGRGLTYTDAPFPATDRGPGYPAFLGILFFIAGGYNLVVIQLAQAILHGGTSYLIYLSARKLYPEREALLAQITCAIFPILIWYSARIWAETLLTFLITAIVYVLILAREKPSTPNIVMLGILLAISLLTKSVLLIFPILLCAVFLLEWGRVGLVRGIAVAAITFLLITPWTIRNYRLIGEFLPVHTSLGINLLEGNVLGESIQEAPFSSHKLWLKGASIADSIAPGWENPATSFHADKILTAHSLEKLRTDTVFGVKRTFTNVCTFFYLGESRIKSFAIMLFMIPLGLFSIRGLTKRWANNRFRMLGWLFIYYVVLHALIYGTTRFAAPVVPLMIVLALGNLTQNSDEGEV